MLHFHKGAPFQGGHVERGNIGIFPGVFNPVTRAHLALVRASIEQYTLRQVVFLLPTSFPHKKYSDTGFENRILLLQAALAEDERCVVASSQTGLFYEIAAEVSECYPLNPQLFFLCGRDAAERIVSWNYDGALSFAQQLEKFELLVASRDGVYQPPPVLKKYIHTVHLSPEWNSISASGFRRAIRQNQNWERFVSPEVARIIRQRGIYDYVSTPSASGKR